MTAPPSRPGTTDPLHVLLVDDEQRVLRGLYRLMRREPSVQVEITDSGSAALEELARQPFDVVVSDLRMPGMDGAELLRRVRTEHPGTVRVMLSGTADDVVLSSLSIAHQFLSKPCESNQFLSAMKSAASLRPLLVDADLREMISSSTSLPSAPSTWTTLQRMLDDPEVSSHDVGEVIAGDVAMATKVLQIVNSAFTGARRRMTDVADAAAYLGTETIRSLVLSIEMFHMFERADSVPDFSVERLSVHAQVSAGLARRMAPRKEIAEPAATAALLQDVGQLLMADAMPDRMAGLLAEAARTGRPLHVVEHEQLGCSHADVGAYLLRLWGLPGEVADAVATSHDPLAESIATPTVAEVTAIAHALVQCYRPDSEDPTDLRPRTTVCAELERAVGAAQRDRWADLAHVGEREAEQ